MIYLISKEPQLAPHGVTLTGGCAEWREMDTDAKIRSLAKEFLDSPHSFFTPLNPLRPSIGLLHDASAYWRGIPINKRAVALIEQEHYAQPQEVRGDALLVAIDYAGEYDEFTKNPFNTEVEEGVEGWQIYTDANTQQ